MLFLIKKKPPIVQSFGSAIMIISLFKMLKDIKVIKIININVNKIFNYIIKKKKEKL
jgi:hypothetical protein